MTIIVTHGRGASETEAIAELKAEGFTAAVAELDPTTTETHEHPYDVCLHILEGELSFTDVERAVRYRCRPGDKLLVGAGSPHHDSHRRLRIVAGRRERTPPV